MRGGSAEGGSLDWDGWGFVWADRRVLAAWRRTGLDAGAERVGGLVGIGFVARCGEPDVSGG